VSVIIEQLLNFKSENPNDPFVPYALAMEYQKIGELQLAVGQYEILVNQFPNYGGTYYHYAQLLEKLNKPESAEKIYQQGLLILKQHGETHLYNELSQAYENFKLNTK